MKRYKTIDVYRCTCPHCNTSFQFDDNDVHFWSDDLYTYGNIDCSYCDITMRVKDEMVIGSKKVEMTFMDRVKAFFCGC